MARTTPLVFPEMTPPYMVAEVVRFYLSHGHFDFIEIRGLEGDWAGFYATRLRSRREEGLLDANTIGLLEAIKFPWDGYAYRWNRMYNELNEHIAMRKRLRHRLMTWWRRQRELDKAGQLEGERIPSLRSVPFPEPTVYHWYLKLLKVKSSIAGTAPRLKADIDWLFEQYDLLQTEGHVQHWNRFCALPDALAEELRHLVATLHLTVDSGNGADNNNGEFRGPIS